MGGLRVLISDFWAKSNNLEKIDIGGSQACFDGQRNKATLFLANTIGSRC